MRARRLYRDGACLVAKVFPADTWWTRLRGLLARPRLASDASEALLIVPCASVHTFGMGYALDVVFLDRDGAVIGTRENVAPWRACAQRDAHSTLELHAGAIDRLAIATGDRLELRG